MKRLLQHNKKSLILILIVVILIAGLLDIIFEGLFYQLLPDSVQDFIKGE